MIGIEKIYAETKELGPIGGDNLGIFGGVDAVTDPLASIADIVSAVIGVMTIAAAVWTLFQIIIGGISWITAGGDKSKLQTARDKITNALIGLIIVVAGWAILALAGQFLGWDNILLGDTDILENLMGN